MIHSTWDRTGRWAAGLNAAFLIAGAILFGPWLGALEAAQAGLAPAEAAAARLVHTYQTLPQVFAFQLLFLLVWWSFVAISMALQARIGQDPRSRILPTIFVGAALLGSMTQFLDLAITSAARTLVPALSAEALPPVALAYGPLREGAAWASSGAFFLLGLGYLIVARLSMAQRRMPRPWALLSGVVGVLALLSLVSAVGDIAALNRMSLMGVIFGSAIWSAWTGWLFREPVKQQREVTYAEA